MPSLSIDGLNFAFPPGWKASKYDDWAFYRNQFVKQRNSLKAVDALAVSDTGVAFLIEVKDYRHPEADKPSDLPQVVADKVLHTLAALLPARLNATEPREREVARAVLQCQSLHVVLHVEQNPRRRVLDLADVKQALKPLLRAVDCHPKLVCMQSTQNMAGLGWTVSSPRKPP